VLVTKRSKRLAMFPVCMSAPWRC